MRRETFREGEVMLYQTPGVARRAVESYEIMGEAALQTAKLGIKGVNKTARAIKKWNNYRPARYTLLDCPKPEAVLAQWNLIQHHRNVVEALRFGAMLLNVTQYKGGSRKHPQKTLASGLRSCKSNAGKLVTR